MCQVACQAARQRSALARRKNGRRSRIKIQTIGMSSIGRRQVSSQVQSRLLKNLDGDTASRLINHAKKSHPGHPEQWYWDKVVYELERDRR